MTNFLHKIAQTKFFFVLNVIVYKSLKLSNKRKNRDNIDQNRENIHESQDN